MSRFHIIEEAKTMVRNFELVAAAILSATVFKDGTNTAFSLVFRSSSWLVSSRTLRKLPVAPSTFPSITELLAADATKLGASFSDETTGSVFPNSTKYFSQRNTRNTKSKVPPVLEFEFHTSIDNISAKAWDTSLAASPAGSSPFVEHSWLQALESSRCASEETGWLPQHLSIKIEGLGTVGYLPQYMKNHSMGEFIFDHAWADAYRMAGMDYYPKLLSAIPFTPCTGPRLLWHPVVYDKFPSNNARRELCRRVGAFLQQMADSNKKLSSVHWNFLTDDEATCLSGPLEEVAGYTSLHEPAQTLLEKHNVKDGYLRRTSIQYHWSNRNPNYEDGRPFQSFDEYLSCFKR